MRNFLRALVCMFPVAVVAQNGQGFDPALLEQLMAQAQQVQVCLAKMDPEELEIWQKRTEAMGAEIDGLCVQGARSKARTKAIAFGREMLASPVFAQLQECTGPLSQLMPQLAWAALDAAESNGQDVCGR